jgi:phosphatidylglycerophosphatase A
VWAASQAEKYFGRTDPGQVVIDEVVGQMITLLLWPGATWKWLLAGFVLFRFFDVVKPFPARRLEHAPSGWGIMLDDVAAGIYGGLALALIGWVRSVI